MASEPAAPGGAAAAGRGQEEREERVLSFGDVFGRDAGGLIVLLILFGALTLASDEFLTGDNLANLARQVAIFGIIAVGQLLVILTAGIDLSVGSVLVFSGVVSAKLMNEVGGNNWGVILIGLAAALASGLAWGLLNGVLIAKAKIPAFIVTLGTLGMSLGAGYLITGGVDEREVPFKLIADVGIGRIAGIPYLVLIALAVAIVLGIILAQTRFGRYTYAIGSNEEAVRRAGVAVDRHLIKIYALAGTLSGLAGFMNLARFGTTTIGGHATDNLNAIAAVVIGGTSLFGGIGSILGTVFGVFIPAVLQNGFVIVGVQAFWQQVAVGAVLILAVYLDQLRRSRRRQ